MTKKYDVCRDFEVSPFSLTVDTTTFVFSSQFSKEKFKRKMKPAIEKLNLMFKSSYGVNNDFKLFSLIHLYSKEEKRGFRIVLDGEVITCLKDITLSGEIKIQKN